MLSDKDDGSTTYGVKKKMNYFTKEELWKLEKQDLIDNVLRLQAHNNQLRNIIAKRKNVEDAQLVGAGLSKQKEKKRKFDFSKCRKRHVFLKFIYLGWDYQGFAVQEDTNETIEGFLFDALIKTCLIPDRQTSNYHRCGRTDKGVSGSAQVISIDIRSKLTDTDKDDTEELPYCKILNRILPEDIRVVSWCPVPDGCSARFNCILRTYKYYFIKGPLNIMAMNEAAKYLIGEHDFRNFCKMDVGNGVVQFNRRIQSIAIKKFLSCELSKNEEFDAYILIFKSNAFLWHQIRCIVSVLLLVGEGKESPNVVKELLDVDKYPRKPQYPPAHHLPLVFHEAQFDVKTDWKYDEEELIDTIEKFQKKWTLNHIKSCQLIDIINDICEEGGIAELPNFHNSGLIPGAEPHVYKPLLQRPLCESLESKINHYVKKQRIEKIDAGDPEENI